jgi:hypothetical protein
MILRRLASTAPIASSSAKAPVLACDAVPVPAAEHPLRDPVPALSL